eukprot:9860-Heterococcus_DN1.PRE.1
MAVAAAAVAAAAVAAVASVAAAAAAGTAAAAAAETDWPMRFLADQAVECSGVAMVMLTSTRLPAVCYAACMQRTMALAPRALSLALTQFVMSTSQQCAGVAVRQNSTLHMTVCSTCCAAGAAAAGLKYIVFIACLRLSTKACCCAASLRKCSFSKWQRGTCGESHTMHKQQ